MTRQAILIVEDEQKLSSVLELELQCKNYTTSNASDGKEALHKIRQNDEVTLIILLTARDKVHDKVSGLNFGVVDYITKLFQIEEPSVTCIELYCCSIST